MGTQNPRFFPLMGTVPSTKYCWASGSCPSVKILSKSVGHGSLGVFKKTALFLMDGFPNYTQRFSFIDLLSDCFCCERVAVSIDCIQNEAQPTDQPDLGYDSKL